MLDTIMRAFTRGINDPDIRRDSLRGLVSANRSLHGVYEAAEEARRVKMEYEHLQEEFTLAHDLHFYRDVVQRNMPSARIDSLRATYQARLLPQTNQQAWPEVPGYGYPSAPHLAPPPHYPPPPRSPKPPQPPQPPQQQSFGAVRNDYRTPYQPAPYNPGPPVMTGAEGGGRSQSNNPYINGSRVFVPGRGVLVCIKCGEDGHISYNCSNPELSRGEQSILRDMVLGGRERLPYRPAMALTAPVAPAAAALPVAPATAGAHSVTYGLAIPRPQPAVRTAHSAEAFIGKGSGPNKRAHIEDVADPVVPPAAFRPTASTARDLPQDIPVQEEDECPKRKGQKRAGKVATIAPLVSLINDETGAMDKPTSVRQLLKSQKIDMTWMDFCVWSPTVCRELKRLLTRVSAQKKKGRAAAEYSQSQTQTGTVNSTAVDGNMRFLSTVMGADKAFRIPCMIRVGGREQELDRSQVQADQGSDMNVISTAMAKWLELPFHSLSDVGFAGLMMKTADHRETLLHHWVHLELGVEGIWRNIQCFVAPELPSPAPGTEHLSLLLGILWLYSVNATIGIRGSRIEISDPRAGEEVRDIVGPELVFSQDHNLLMYPKAILARLADESDSSETEEESDSSVSLSEDDEPPSRPKKGFR